MNRRLLFSLGLLTILSTTAHAELRLLASATSDSYQLLTFGLSSFCQAAGFPFALTEINDEASKMLVIPNLAGLDVQQHLWLLWLADASTNQPAPDVVSVAILPTADNALTTRQALANAYPLRTEDDVQMIWRYAMPDAAPGAAAGPLPSAIYVAVRHGLVIVSASRDAVLWVTSRPLPTPPAGETAIAGQIRFEIQPAAIAALLAGRREHAGSDRLLETSTRLLADIRAVTLVLETTTDGITLHLSVTPNPGTPLARLFFRIHPPAAPFWRVCPEQATVAMASGGASIWDISDAYGTNRTAQTHTAESLLGDCLTGDSAVFIGRSSTTSSLYYAEVLGITNRAVAWPRACADPQALLPFTTSFRFVTNGMRTVAGTPVLDLGRGTLAAASSTDATRNPADMAAFMVRDGGVSVAVTSNLLAVTFGSSNAIEQVLQRLADLPAGALPLPTRCRKLLPAAPDAPCAAMLLLPAGLIRQIAASLPGLRADRVASLPQPGDGIAAILTRDPDGTLQLKMRFSANEVSRFQEAMSKGQDALQEMFMRMALQQVLQIERKIDDSDPRAPK